ncbi:RNA deprotection pyrophosphohydrolase [Niallia sp. Krafla_26]|uniref:RNA deprotection pyrophosphohydrolase n=1 Tax=Niallia sp. Krafla_26 TaxID=3064703 RepID=UPI003D171BB1
METFKDVNGSTVKLSFTKNAFTQKPEHVLVICQLYKQWLLTKHKQRGLEFPGGKREAGEALEEAATREVYEETGATLNSLDFIGEYQVSDDQNSFVKAIFYGEVESIHPKSDYFETNGPVLVSGDLLTLRMQDSYSFIMQDRVIEKVMNKIQEKNG